jgi:hypothetical protein
MAGKPKCYIVQKSGKRIYFATYAEAKKWNQAQPKYPKEVHHVYSTEPDIPYDRKKKIFGKVKPK